MIATTKADRERAARFYRDHAYFFGTAPGSALYLATWETDVSALADEFAAVRAEGAADGFISGVERERSLVGERLRLRARCGGSAWLHKIAAEIEDGRHAPPLSATEKP